MSGHSAFTAEASDSEFAHTNAQGEVSLDGFGGCAELSEETSHKGCRTSEIQAPLNTLKRQAHMG